jgi:osmotically-inducible protein OsmY
MLCLALFAGVTACNRGPEDSTITANVKAKLAADPATPATAINVDTKDGVVTLTGTVASAAAKTKAEADAKAVEGVKSVANNLTVSAPPVTTAPATSDTAIKSSVEANLAKAGITGVTVRVDGGVVYLTGKVPAASFVKANQAAQEATPKPTRVDNSGLTRS